MKKKVQDGVASLLFWVLVPSVAAVALGYITERYLPWLNRWVGASIFLALATLLGAWRSKPAEGVGWIRFIWLLASLVLFGVTGYFEWQHLGWTWSPWFGAGLAGIIWLGIGLTGAFLIGSRTKSGGVPIAHVTTSASQSSGGREMNVTQQLMASLGLPIGSQATVDLAKLLNAMADQAIANGKLGDAAIMEQANKAVELGVLKPEMLTDRACELCGIELKAPQQTAQEPRTQPERPQVTTVKWDGI